MAFHACSKELPNGYLWYSPLLLLLFFIASCAEHDKTKERVNERETSPIVVPEKILPAEDPSFVMSKDTVSTHGPRNITRNILQDKNGNYWFATWEGIIRYDGKRFVNVTLQEGLRHFHVFSILEDKSGNLWFGTIGGGAYCYDGKSFTYFTTADGLVSNAIMCIQEDNFGNIWFGTDGGVSRYDGNTFTNFTTQDGLGSNFISCIVQDKTGKLWFGNNGGINYYDPLASPGSGAKSFINFTNEKGLPFYRTRSMIEDKTGNIWIGSADGLCRYDGKSFTNFTTNSVYNIVEDKTGNLWLSSGEANDSYMVLLRFDGASFVKIKRDKQIFGVIQDRTGNIWFGTQDGASRYDGKSFTNFWN